jgi:hypothetical protein
MFSILWFQFPVRAHMAETLIQVERMLDTRNRMYYRPFVFEVRTTGSAVNAHPCRLI